MVQKRTCDYSGQEIEPGTGTMLVKKDGTVLWFADAKCEKNYRMGREARELEWVGDDRDDAEEEAEADSEEPDADDESDTEAESDADESDDDAEAESDADDAESEAESDDEAEDEEAEA